MRVKTVLFICSHNSGRSQMAEALLKKMSEGLIRVESAGLEPKPILPIVIEVMQEDGIDLTTKTSQSVFDLYKKGRLFDVVITVCDDITESMCPVFAGITTRLNWPFPDPEKLTGSHEEKLNNLRKIRDNIKAKIKEWMEEINK